MYLNTYSAHMSLVTSQHTSKLGRRLPSSKSTPTFVAIIDARNYGTIYRKWTLNRRQNRAAGSLRPPRTLSAVILPTNTCTASTNGRVWSGIYLRRQSSSGCHHQTCCSSYHSGYHRKATRIRCSTAPFLAPCATLMEMSVNHIHRQVWYHFISFSLNHQNHWTQSR